MFAVLRYRNFALLWFGQLVSLIGDWVLIVALPFYVYQLTGSVLQTGGMFLVETLPRVVLGSFAGVFVDRWDRRWTMIFSDVLRAGTLLLLLLVHSPGLLWLIYGVAAVQAIIGQFFIPAVGAITPLLVDEQQLLAANTLESLTDSLTRLIGPPIGGALFAVFGLLNVVLVDSASFLFSALMVWQIVLPHGRVMNQGVMNVAPTISVRDAFLKVWREWLEGFRVVRSSQTISGIFIAFGVLMVAQGILNVSILVFIKQVMHGSALVFGWFITSQGIGSIIGALLIGRVSKLVRPSYMVAAGLFIAGADILLVVNLPILTVALLSIALAGVFIVGLFVSMQTLLQQETEDSYRGRVLGAYNTTLALTTMIGIVLSSAFGDQLGSVQLLDFAALLFFVSGLIGLAMLRDARLKQGENQKPEIAESA